MGIKQTLTRFLKKRLLTPWWLAAVLADVGLTFFYLAELAGPNPWKEDNPAIAALINAVGLPGFVIFGGAMVTVTWAMRHWKGVNWVQILWGLGSTYGALTWLDMVPY